MTEENGQTNEAPEIAAAFDVPTDDAQRDDALEIWLRGEAAVPYDKMKAEPSRALSAREVFGDNFGGN